MADALNRRLHDETVAADAPTVTAGRGHRIGVGDIILIRRNDYDLHVVDEHGRAQTADPVRNGNRWSVFAVHTDNGRVAARRHSRGARAVFTGDYLREHITHGYATIEQGADRRLGRERGSVFAALGRPTNGIGLARISSAVYKNSHDTFHVDQQRRIEAGSCVDA